MPKPNVIVFTINGQPKSGKDTFVEGLTTLCQNTDIAVYNVSTIDAVRQVVRDVYPGRQFTFKVNEERQLLVDVGDALQKFSNFKVEKAIERVQECVRGATRLNVVIFIHAREKEILEDIENRVYTLGYKALSLFINRPSKDTLIVRDAVAETDRDNTFVVQNDLSLENFKLEIFKFQVKIDRILSYMAN